MRTRTRPKPRGFAVTGSAFASECGRKGAAKLTREQRLKGASKGGKFAPPEFRTFSLMSEDQRREAARKGGLAKAAKMQATRGAGV